MRNDDKIKYIAGDKYKTNSGYSFTILERIKGQKKPRIEPRFLIEFDETGYKTEVVGVAIKSGNIKDRFAKDILGVACLGNAKKIPNVREHSVWTSMISRCYNPKNKKFKYYGGNNVTVSERWRCFEYFLIDLSSVDGYDIDLFSNGLIELDKDIKQKDSKTKVYSLETCGFVTREENQNQRRKNKK